MDDSRNLCDVAQPRCDDVVIAAAAFGPNAAGRRELSTLRGMSQRQVLKSRGAYLADRVLLAVTPLEVIAIALGPVSSRFREVLRWRRDTMLVRAIESNVGAGRACRPAQSSHDRRRAHRPDDRADTGLPVAQRALGRAGGTVGACDDDARTDDVGPAGGTCRAG